MLHAYRRFTCLVLCFAIGGAPAITSQAAAAGPQSPSTQVVGDPNLTSTFCGEILTNSYADLLQELIEKSVSKSEVLELMYQGGLIFNDLFFKAVFQTLGADPNSVKSSSKIKLIRQIAKLIESPQNAIAQFTANVLLNEKSLIQSSQQIDSVQKSVKIQLIDSLVKRLNEEQSPNLKGDVSKAIQDAFVAVTTETLLQLAENVVASLPYKNFLVGSVTFALGMTGAGAGAGVGHFFGPHGELAGFIIAGASTAALGFVTNGVQDLVTKFYKILLKKSRRLFPRINFAFPNLTGEDRIDLAAALNEYAKHVAAGQTSSDNTMSIDTAQRVSNVAQLTPLQIATLGEIEMDKLDGLANALIEQDEKIHKNGADLESAVKTSAQELLAAPDHFQLQKELMIAISNLNKWAAESQPTEAEAYKTIRNQLVQINAALENLHRRAYTDPIATSKNQLASESIARSMLLAKQMENKLNLIQSLEGSMNTNDYAQKIEELDRLKQNTQLWLMLYPKAIAAKSAWIQFANAVLAALPSSNAKESDHHDHAA